MDRQLKERLTGGVILLGLGIIITPILLDEPVDQGPFLEQDVGHVPDKNFDPEFVLPKEPTIPKELRPVTKTEPPAVQGKAPVDKPQPAVQGKAPVDKPQPAVQGKAPTGKPQPAAQGKAPVDKPQPAAQGKAPVDKPQPAAQGKAPTDKPQPAAQGKAPTDKPQPAAQGKAPADKPQPAAQGEALSTTPSPPLTSTPDPSALVGEPPRIVKKKAVTSDALKTTTITQAPRANKVPAGAQQQSSPPGPLATKAEQRIPSPPLPTKGQAAPGEGTAVDNAVWTVQLGGFSKKKNATQLVNKIRTLGKDKYRVFIDTVSRGNGRQIHRVRVGPVSRQQANQQRDELEKELGTRGVIMRDTRNR